MIEKFEDWTNHFKKPEDEPGYQWFFAWSNYTDESSLGRWTKVPVAQDKDQFTCDNPDYKPKEEIEGLSTDVDYYLIKNVINSNNPDAKKIAIYLKEMTEQKLKKLAYPCNVMDFDFDITEENEDHFIQWIVAEMYLYEDLENTNIFYVSNKVTKKLINEYIFDYIHDIEGTYEKTEARFERIKRKVTEHVLMLMRLDEFINN